MAVPTRIGQCWLPMRSSRTTSSVHRWSSNAAALATGQNWPYSAMARRYAPRAGLGSTDCVLREVQIVHSRRGPGYAQIDLRAGYRIRLRGGHTLDAFLDVFNLTNRANFANPSVDQRLPATFLRLLDVSDEGPTRTAQLNFRFGF